MRDQEQPDFQKLRDAWALRSPVPSKEDMDYEFRKDQMLNPHNEPYHNKKPRREAAQIHSDRAYAFADTALKQQYGRYYVEWLESFYVKDQWGDGYRVPK